MRMKYVSPWVIIVLFVTFFSQGAKSQIILQRCDLSNLWQGSNTISINTVDKKEGNASISFSGSGTDWFIKKFSQIDLGIDEGAWLNLWLYVSDVSMFDGDGQIELSSSGESDKDEYAWSISTLSLVNGWNYVQLQFLDALKTGAPDLEAINYIRIYQVLSGEVLVKLDDIRVSKTKDPEISDDDLNIKTPDFTSLDGKVMFGYQGWFSHPDDGSELAKWRHWGTMEDASSLQVEMYPDMREHEADENYSTGLTFSDGRPVMIYSAYNRKTVMRHMKWLRDYDLDGVFLQRFNTSLRDGRLRKTRDTVTVNVMLGCEKYGRAFVNMYDLSGLGGGNIDELIADWKHLVDDLKITESPNYLHHRGKPLVSLWGFTVRDDLPVSDLEQAIEFFTNSPDEKYRASIMLGVNDDFFSRNSWVDALSEVDVISPWAVGRFNSISGNASFIENRVKPGQDWCDQRNIDFLPIVWPGFSWYNLKGEGSWQKNQIPRNGGEFFWAQATRTVSANAKSVYIAMFDEVDEATAMYKLSETREDAPEQGFWLPLDADGLDLPSDWYLRCAKKLSHVVRGIEDNSSTLGTPPDGIDDFSVSVQSTKCGNTEGKLTFSYPQVSAESLLEFSIDGGNTYPYSTLVGSETMETGVLAGGVYNVWVRRNGGDYPTDLGPYNIFDFTPDASIVVENTTCGLVDGSLLFRLGNNPYLGPLQISTDGGENFDYLTTDGDWTYSIDGLARGDYDVWIRWADELCPVSYGTIKVDADPIPITLLASVDGGAYVESSENKVYACEGFSFDLKAEPSEDSWTWAWKDDDGVFSANGRSIRIADEMASENRGKYYVSYRDDVNDCEINDFLFFIWEGTDCPVMIDASEIKNGVYVFPNPAKDHLNIFCVEGDTYSVQLLDMSGKVLLSENRCLGANQIAVDISGLKDGAYLYRIKNEENDLLNGTFIKQ